MSLAVCCPLNQQTRPFSTLMAPELAYHSGKKEIGEEPVSKRQIRSGNGRWARRHGVGRLNSRREAQIHGVDKEVSKEKQTNKLIYEGQQGAADTQDSWGPFRDAQGFGRLDSGSRASCPSSRPPPPRTSVCCGLEKLICDLSSLLLRTLVVYRRSQSQYGIRRFGEPF